MFSAVVRQGRRRVSCSSFQKRGNLAFAFVVAVIDEGMVERVGNVLFDDGFQVGKVHHHAVFLHRLG